MQIINQNKIMSTFENTRTQLRLIGLYFIGMSVCFIYIYIRINNYICIKKQAHNLRDWNLSLHVNGSNGKNKFQQ